MREVGARAEDEVEGGDGRHDAQVCCTGADGTAGKRIWRRKDIREAALLIRERRVCRDGVQREEAG